MTNIFDPFSITFKPVKDVADRAGDGWIAAEIKLDEELGKVDGAKGTAAALAGA